MPRPLFVDADLRLTVDGAPVRITGSGRDITVDVDRAQTAWRLFRAHRPGADAVRSITDLLDTHDVDVEVQVGGRPVGRVGATAEPGRLSRALGVPVQIQPTPVMRGAFWGALALAALGGLAFALRRR
ncbi:MAG: hypothetical protein AAGI52_15515 [Bacteroidota bacterium]